MNSPIRLDVGLVAPVFNNAPLWVAEQTGLFAEHGIEVQVTVLFGVENVTNSLLDGSSQIAIGTPESVLSQPEPARLVIVGGNASKLSNALIARRGITSFAQIAGGTIGVSHETEGTGLLVREMMSANGIPQDAYTVQAIGVASKRWEALVSGTIAAGLQTSPHRYIAEELGYPSLGQIADYVPEYQFTTVNARRDWLDEHPGIVRTFLRCLSQATAWMSTHRDETIAIAAERMSSTLQHTALDYEHFTSTHSLDPGLGLSAEGMDVVVRLMTRAGTLRATTARQRARRIDLALLP